MSRQTRVKVIDEKDPVEFEPGKIHQIKSKHVAYDVDMTPAIGLCNPKYPHNVGAAVRAASCFGAKCVMWDGNRVVVDDQDIKTRIPREERMKGYRDVLMMHDQEFSYRFDFSVVTPVAVEVRPNSENLVEFVHPENPLYIFGPEDGSLPKGVLHFCHRFVVIPSAHCLNLGNAVNVILYDRFLKQTKNW